MMNCHKDGEVFRPLSTDTFSFSCHRGIECFTRCCAKLHLVLTPYDILRMKKRLGLSSGDFLAQYTDMVIDDHSRFPMVRLRMRDGEKKRCPFVTRKGCTIYEDRPGACRIYPLGRASTMVNGEKNTKERFFIVDESHCLGIREEKVWTLQEWLTHEGVSEYNAMNDQWLPLITTSKRLGHEHATQKLQMFSMASYNLDKFKEFLFTTRFFKIFEVASEVKEKVACDDVALMKFAFVWLKFSLFGDKTIRGNSLAL